jgi:hypothetical protein
MVKTPFPNQKIAEEAMNQTYQLLAQLEIGKIDDSEVKTKVTSLLANRDSTRGFFVAYLPDERKVADYPSSGLLEALKTAPEFVSEFLVKNLAMSITMAIYHRRNNNEEIAQGSDQVKKRTINLIQKLQLDEVSEELQQLRQTIETGTGSYQAFLDRFNYDAEQLQAILQVIIDKF